MKKFLIGAVALNVLFLSVFFTPRKAFGEGVGSVCLEHRWFEMYIDSSGGVDFDEIGCC